VLVAAATVSLGLLAAAPVFAATIHVNCANANLQKKINNAAPGSTLEIKGTCKGRFTIGKKLALVGDPSATLDGEKAGAVLTIFDGPVRLARLTVKNGFVEASPGQGAGISDSSGKRLTLSHVTLTANRVLAESFNAAANGGGLFKSSGTLVVTHSRVSGNAVRADGDNAFAQGAGIDAFGTVKVVDSRFVGNRATAVTGGTQVTARGAGLLAGLGDVDIEGSTFEDNLARANATSAAADAQGGALALLNAGTFNVERTTFRANRAVATTTGTDATAQGGAIGGNLTGASLARTKLLGNTTHVDAVQDATSGGGSLSLIPSGEVKLVRTRIASSSVDVHSTTGAAVAQGGGIEVLTGSLTLLMTTIDANTADVPEGPVRQAFGGGLYASTDLTLVRSTLSRNDAASNGGQALGGAIALIGGSASIVNSTIAANAAHGSTARGGGIDTQVDTSIVNTTIWGNTAKIGGGLYTETATTILFAALLAGNKASEESPNCGGNIGSDGYNLISKTTECLLSSAPTDILDQLAGLGSFGHHGGPTETVSLEPTSKAVNAVPPIACPVERDQRGVKRPQGNRCDIGAFEVRR